MHALTTPTRTVDHVARRGGVAILAPARTTQTAAPWTVSSRGGGPVAAQGGFFDDLLGQAVPGVMGAASSLLGGDGGAAVGQLQQTGATLAPGAVQHGSDALGALIGGGAGAAVSSLGGTAGQALGSMISGEQSPREAAGGVGQDALPMMMQLLTSLLRR